MATMSIKKFSGALPRMAKDRIPEGFAQAAENCDFAYGELRPLKGLGPHFAADVGAQPVRGIFTDDGNRYFCWSLPTQAYLAPTIDDAVGRVYYHTQGGVLRVAVASDMKAANLAPGAPVTSWKVGVTAPPAPATTLGATTGGDDETVAVVAVAINIWGEESAPSAAVLVTKEAGQAVTYEVTHTAPVDEQTLQGIVFYRTYPAQGESDYVLINATPAPLVGGVATYVDTTTAPVESTTLASALWDTPPTTPANFTYSGNGAFCVSQGKDLVFSEPYHPHAWPYRMTFPSVVLGVVAIEGGVLVSTQTHVHMVTGQHPSQLAERLFPAEQAAWSGSAMARVEASAVYASNDGIVDVFGGQPSLKASQQMFTREVWRNAYGPARLNLRLAHHDGRVLGIVDPSYPLSVVGDNFLLSMDESGSAYSTFDLGSTVYSARATGTTDQMMVTTATGFAEFAVGSPLQYTWQSGEKWFSRPVSMPVLRVDCDGPVVVEVYADGALRHTASLSQAAVLRMEPEPRARRWSVKVVGTGVVREVSLASTVVELRGL